MSLDRSIAELQSDYTLRFRHGQWFVYKGTDPLDCFIDAREALKALRELQSAEVKNNPRSHHLDQEMRHRFIPFTDRLRNKEK